MIHINNPKDIAYMRTAGLALASWMYTCTQNVSSGIWSTGNQIERNLHSYCTGLEGQWDMPFQYVGDYGHATCISINDEIVHSRPTDEPFKQGDVITIDAGLSYNGLCSDMARTVIYNMQSDTINIPTENIKLILDVAIAYVIAQNACRPGAKIVDISKIIYEFAQEHGYGVVTAFGGHGIGRDIHMEPLVPNSPYNVVNDAVLRPGMTICIEPMFILGGNGSITIDQDKWRVFSGSGQVAAHHENTILITKKGQPQVLTQYDCHR